MHDNTIDAPNKQKKKDLVSWKTVLITFICAILIPYGFIYFITVGVDSGYWGGKPAYVSGNGVMVWILEKLHLVIIGSILSTILFLFILVVKLYEVVKNKILN